MTTFYIGKDDTSPSLGTTLESPDGTAKDVTGATIVFDMWDEDGTQVITGGSVTLDDPANGVVSFDFSAAQTATAGMYFARWTVTYVDTTVETFPNSGYDQIVISGDPTGYEITVAQVLDGISTGASEADIAGLIAVVDQADACLTSNSVGALLGRQLKILGVRHLAQSAADRGAVVSERAVSGASRTYAERKGGETGHLATLRSIDQYGCVMSVLNRNARVQFRAVGRRSTATAD